VLKAERERKGEKVDKRGREIKRVSEGERKRFAELECFSN